MNIKKSCITGKSLAWLLTLIYFTRYITRKSFATVLQQVISETGIAKDTLSVVLVSMTVTYGIGQLINGRLGDKFNPANLIFCGLIAATSVNLIFPFISKSVPAMAIFWGINGFAQSMMWPPIVKILVASCDETMYGYSVVRISWGSSFATIALYFLAPLVIFLTGSWKALFFISAAVGLFAAIFWFFMKHRISIPIPVSKPEISEKKEKTHFRIPRTAIFPIVFIMLGIIFQGMLRDGIATWMPTYLSDVHNMSNRTSILSGVFPAIFSIACFSISGALYKRFFTNEVVCGGVVFGVAVLAAATLFLLFGKSPIVAIICLTLITGCMHGTNLMLITHVPKRFKKHGNISTFAGIVNACTYVGEAIFTYGIAVLAERFNWHVCIGICLIIAALGTSCCFIAAIPWKKFTEQ